MNDRQSRIQALEQDAAYFDRQITQENKPHPNAEAVEQLKRYRQQVLDVLELVRKGEL